MSCPHPADIWTEKPEACQALLSRVQAVIRESEGGLWARLADTEACKEKVAYAVHYEMGPTDTAYAIIDDYADQRWPRKA